MGCVIPHGKESAQEAAMPLMRETMIIMVNGKPVVVYKDEIEKQIYARLYEQFNLQYGA